MIFDMSETNFRPCATELLNVKFDVAVIAVLSRTSLFDCCLHPSEFVLELNGRLGWMVVSIQAHRLQFLRVLRLDEFDSRCRDLRIQISVLDVQGSNLIVQAGGFGVERIHPTNAHPIDENAQAIHLGLQFLSTLLPVEQRDALLRRLRRTGGRQIRRRLTALRREGMDSRRPLHSVPPAQLRQASRIGVPSG
ncbi:hypothetical protein [Rhodococcus sp. HNM0563]|uniref:hypothetical protein n=1 Tax=Rhodococcus sp. HNM0563 TaxID=2716339 RepID=UPI001F0F96C6|nr:hypothetical protein [Rhodococcus sp. HNM0563]